MFRRLSCAFLAFGCRAGIQGFHARIYLCFSVFSITQIAARIKAVALEAGLASLNRLKGFFMTAAIVWAYSHCKKSLGLAAAVRDFALLFGALRRVTHFMSVFLSAEGALAQNASLARTEFFITAGTRL